MRLPSTIAEESVKLRRLVEVRRRGRRPVSKDGTRVYRSGPGRDV